MSEAHRTRRRGIAVTALVAVAIVAGAAVALFQPWKLWVDDVVQQAAPAGAVPITLPDVASTTTPARPPAPTVTMATPAPTGEVTASTLPVAPPPTAPATTAAPPPPTPAVPVGGAFISRDHGTSGTVVLLADPAGAQFVRLADLDTSNGPDLFVYLSTNPPDGPEDAFDDDIVSLGRLQGNVGSANYAVPAGTDLTRFASVVIWCDRFDSAFGAAPLT